MTKKVLVIGGYGRIGKSVAQDLLKYTNAEVTITSRQTQSEIHPLNFLALDLSDRQQLHQAIAQQDLIIHCAGPFHHRDGRVLASCIDQGIDYIDVSDHRSFYQQAIKYQEQAIASGVTAILNTGIFPGISNSMVKQGVEQFDQPEKSI